MDPVLVLAKNLNGDVLLYMNSLFYSCVLMLLKIAFDFCIKNISLFHRNNGPHYIWLHFMVMIQQ